MAHVGGPTRVVKQCRAKAEVDILVDPRIKEHLRRDIESEDLLGAVLRSHLWVENELIRIIRESLPVPDSIDLDRLSFPSKIELACALGMIPIEDMPAYRNLNALRNRLAHRFNSEVTEEDERSLLANLSPRSKEIAHSSVIGPERDFPTMLQASLATMIIGLRVSHEKLLREKEETRRLHEEVVELLGGQAAYERKVQAAQRARHRPKQGE
jgi:hypothetical protein